VRARSPYHRTLVAILALLLATPNNYALLNLDGTRNQIFIFGNLTLGYDSNIFARQGGGGDYTQTATVGAELKRRAGIIAVNSKAVLDYQRFDKYSDQSSWNPHFDLEFSKTTGRTTGALTFSAYRTTRADTAVNLRTTSWNFPVSLSLKYPVDDNFYVTSRTTYLQRRYDSDAGLRNYRDYSEGIDAFYVFSSKLDLFAGYRYRYATTDLGHATDHNFSVGATGGLLPKLNGLLRFGYQIRRDYATGEKFGQVSAAGALIWNATRKLSVTGELSRDFSTTATGVSVDTLSASLRGDYIFTRRFQVAAGIGGGENRFLDRDQRDRHDEFFTFEASATYTWSEHLKVTGSYNYLRNWSTLALSDFQRHGFSVDISSRY
jgi:hypothetical protein